MNDVRQLGTTFSEDVNYSQSWSGNAHQLRGRSIDGNSFTFTVIGANGTSIPSGGTITVLLRFTRDQKQKIII